MEDRSLQRQESRKPWPPSDGTDQNISSKCTDKGIKVYYDLEVDNNFRHCPELNVHLQFSGFDKSLLLPTRRRRIIKMSVELLLDFHEINTCGSVFSLPTCPGKSEKPFQTYSCHNNTGVIRCQTHGHYGDGVVFPRGKQTLGIHP